jgi:hypothetical protein
MLPPRSGLGRTRLGRGSLDPDGYYARLGLDPAAPQTSIHAAYRAKARLVHPDVPKTGNADAFVAVKQAYDVLSNPELRGEYDRPARDQATEPEVIVVRPAVFRPATDLVRPLPLSGVTIGVLAGLSAFLCLSVYEVATHLLIATTPAVNAGIRPNAATVQPLSASEHRAVLYGPAPIRLGGTPNFYVVPAGSPAVLWRLDPDHGDALAPLGELPPFSALQAIRVIRQTGMLEVVVNDRVTGFVSADHLMPGDATAAQTAYCSYNSGPPPFSGELLERRGSGSGTLTLENRAVQPAVVKLRDAAGAVMVSVFLGPSGRADLDGLPQGQYRPEFAIGELWSRACNTFAAGMRARRMAADVSLPGAPNVVIEPDGGGTDATDISDQMFQKG